MRLNYPMGSEFLRYSMSQIYTHTKLRKQEKMMNSQRFSGESRCQLQISHRWSGYWINEWVRRLGESNTLSIWSNGRTIQLKMPAGRMKRRYKSMDIPCRISWIGSHESFQVREYDVGAFPTSSEPAQKARDSWTHASTNFEIFLKLLHHLK
jgi:hypothetical protein